MHFRLITAAAILVSAATPALAKQPIETETARLPKKGHGDVQLEFEYGTSSEGSNIAFPIVLEYGVTDRLKFVIEPDLYASIKPKGTKGVHGFGETEAKLVYLVAEEDGSRPAIAIAGEVKIPTGKRPDLSTGKLDYRVFGVVSKRSGRWDLHANLGYTFIGAPAGENPPNELGYSVAAEYEVSPKFTLVSEVLGNSPIGGSKTVIPGADGEGSVFTGLIGGIYKFSERADFSLAATYDSGSMFLVRTALTFRF